MCPNNAYMLRYLGRPVWMIPYGPSRRVVNRFVVR